MTKFPCQETNSRRNWRNTFAKVKAMLNVAKIDLGVQFDVEYSHHYGIERFGEVGCVLIDCINREYCKKLLVQLPKQSHPPFPRLKEETFQVLHGEVFLGNRRARSPHVPRRYPDCHAGHGIAFGLRRCIVEEKSRPPIFQNDSVYKDPAINEMSKQQRKTVVKHWGRFHISRQLGEDKTRPQNTRVNFHRDEFRQGPPQFTHFALRYKHQRRRAKYGTYGHTRHLETSADKSTKIDEDLGYAVFDGGNNSIIKRAIACAEYLYSPDVIQKKYREKGGKGPFCVVDCDNEDPESKPIFDLAEDEYILDPYDIICKQPVIVSVQVWFSLFNSNLASFNSQLFHFDQGGLQTNQVFRSHSYH